MQAAISRLGQGEFDRLAAEGLKPTFADAVTLNALGLKVEHGPRSASFADLPRVAYLGDLILIEPSVGKWLWLDAATAALPSIDAHARLNLAAFALSTDDADLPDAARPRAVAAAVRKFRDRHLLRLSVSEIVGAVGWALNGCDPYDCEDPEITKPDKRAPDPRELPHSVRSAAHELLLSALAVGIDRTAAESVTVPQLERMLVTAAIVRGADFGEGDHTDAVARFYRGAYLIQERLKKEKEHANG